MLSGIRIIDLTRYFPGPFATLRLMERGAEVIKVEDKIGDPARYMDRIEGEEGAIFRCMNRGKKAVSLDLKLESDREILLSLAETADVFVESFRPGVTKRLGIDYEAVSKRNPSIVYVSMSGFGQNSSIAHLGSHDINYLSLSGVLSQLLDEQGKPIKPTLAIADLVSGMAVSEAILTGCLNKQRTGKGSYMDIAMTDTMVSLMQLIVTKYSATGDSHGVGNFGLGKGVFKTKDGKYISMCAVEEKFYTNFCKAVGKEHLIAHQKEEAVVGNPNYDEIIALFAERSFDEWCDFSVKVDCCMTPVLDVADLKNHPYIRERGLIESKWGLDYVTTRYNADGKGFLDYERPFPKLGEDNALLNEFRP